MLKRVRSGGDAFGKALIDFHNTGEETISIIRRVEDNNVDEMPSSPYFRAFDEWDPLDRALSAWMEGRVLDIGMGAGRLSLHLQGKGHDVVGVDLSPGALEVSSARGVRDVRQLDILDGILDGEKFRTIALFGHNLGIAGFHENVGSFLELLSRMLTPGGRIVGTQINWDRTDKPEHLGFQEANRRAGRHPVDMTLRIEYGGIEETFSWCLTNQTELVEIAKSVGLAIEAIIDCGGMYSYVLRLPES